MITEKSALLHAYPYLEEYRTSLQSSRIRLTDDFSAAETSVDPLSIDFQPLNVRQKMSFRSLLESELKLRNVPIYPQSDIASLRLSLRELLISEARYKLVIEVLAETDDEKAMIRLEQALPCFLHLQNRSSETIIEFLLRHGLLIREGCKESQKAMMNAVESLVNREIFGSYGCHSNWRFPINTDGSMGAIKFADWRARRIVEFLPEIINLCLPGNDQVHMLGAGHVRYYLQKWGNLNRFSNQGWEAYNSLVTSYWHHRTRKGGGRLNRSKILPIAQWILRLMLWRTGEAQKFFKSCEDNNSEDESLHEEYVHNEANDGDSFYDDSDLSD